MEENIININDINIKLEKLSKRYEVLEEKNSEYEKRIKRNEDTIINLNKQLLFVRQEYKKQINELKKNELKLKDIIINEEEKKYNIKSLYAEIEKLVKLKLDDFKFSILEYLGKTPTEGNNEKIIKYQGRTLLDKYENHLFNIFFDQNKNISLVDISKLRKLTAAILIKYNDKEYPLESVKLLLEKNVNKNVDEFTQMNIDLKRTKIFEVIEDVKLKNIDKINKDEFMKKFKEKYGILNDDISEKELKYEIEYRNYNEGEIIKIILERLGYLKFK